MGGRIDILGAGLSGLAAATILAKAGKEVHVHEIRKDSGARFDGDFQGIENWTSDIDFFEEMREWGLNPDEFKSNAFEIIDLIIRAFVREADEVIVSTPCFVPYKMFSRWSGAQVVDIPLFENNYSLNVNGILKSVTDIPSL